MQKSPSLIVIGTVAIDELSTPFGSEQTIGRVKYITELAQSKADLEAFLADPSRYGRMVYANLLKDALTRASDQYVQRFRDEFLQFVESAFPEIGKSIVEEQKLTDETAEALGKALTDFKAQFAVEG